MKTGFDLLSVFEKKQDEYGEEYFAGELDVSQFKKMKENISVVLMKGEFLPNSLVGIEGNSKGQMFLFSRESSPK